MIKTIFLNKEYSFPKQLLIYLDALALAEKVQDNLLLSFSRKMNNLESFVVDENEFQEDFKASASLFLKKLFEYDIYNKTIDEYVFQNKGYNLFHQTNQDALYAQANILLDTMENYQRNLENAERDAASNITGSGVSVWSSSFITLAATAAMEYSTLKKQSNKADRELNLAIQRISEQATTTQNQKKIEYTLNTYYPNIRNAITVFAFGLLDHFINDLIEKGAFNKEVIEYVDTKRSSDLLKSLDIATNKIAVLEQAFIVCPFNVNIYYEIFKLNLLDADIINTLKLLQQFDVFYSSLKQEFEEENITDDIESDLIRIDNLINALCLCTGLKKIEYIQEFTKKTYTAIIEKYALLRNQSIDSEECKTIVEDLGERVIDITESELDLYLEEKITSIISNKNFDCLIVKCGYTSLVEDIRPKNSDFKNKSEIDSYYKHEILKHLKPRIIVAKERILAKKAQEKEAFEKEAKQKSKTKALFFIGSAVAIVLPIIIYFILQATLVNQWKNEMESIIVSSIEQEIEKETQNPNSTYNKIGGTGAYEIVSIDYYMYSERSLYIVPTIRIYYSNSNATWKDRISIANELSIDSYYKYEIPSYIDLGAYHHDNVSIGSDYYFENSMGQVDDYVTYADMRNMKSQKISFVSGWLIPTYIVLAIIICATYIYLKKKDFYIPPRNSNQ